MRHLKRLLWGATMIFSVTIILVAMIALMNKIMDGLCFLIHNHILIFIACLFALFSYSMGILLEEKP